MWWQKKRSVSRRARGTRGLWEWLGIPGQSPYPKRWEWVCLSLPSFYWLLRTCCTVVLIDPLPAFGIFTHSFTFLKWQNLNLPPPQITVLFNNAFPSHPNSAVTAQLFLFLFLHFPLFIPSTYSSITMKRILLLRSTPMCPCASLPLSPLQSFYLHSILHL